MEVRPLRQCCWGYRAGATVGGGLGVSAGVPGRVIKLRVSMKGKSPPFFQGIWARGAAVPRRHGGVPAGPLAGDPLTAHLAQLASALGTGLIIQGEHLAVHHLPSFVVAVSAHRAALAIRVERVGAGDGAVHR